VNLRHRRRVYSALVFFPCFYVLVHWLPPIAFTFFVAAGVGLAQYEFYRLYFPTRWSTSIGLGLGLGLLVIGSFAAPGLVSDRALVAVIVCAVLLNQFWTGHLKPGIQDSAVIAFGIFYIAWLVGHMIPIRQFDHGSFLIFFLFLVTWANDTAAYYAGTFWGRHQMAPITSPRKTWEGAAGGLIGSIGVALACHAWFLPSLSAANAVAIAVVLSIAGPLGDLCESVLKRSAGVKDSGAVIPGHGGVLDRIDSLIFTTPAFYYCLLAMRAA
jgi:phosphatidate cytidylyltransferase